MKNRNLNFVFITIIPTLLLIITFQFNENKKITEKIKQKTKTYESVISTKINLHELFKHSDKSKKIDQQIREDGWYKNKTKKELISYLDRTDSISNLINKIIKDLKIIEEDTLIYQKYFQKSALKDFESAHLGLMATHNIIVLSIAMKEND